MIPDMIHKKMNQVVNELIIRGRKLNISLAFITQSYFTVPKHARLNCTFVLLWKLQNNESFNRSHLTTY